jgi:hypothetical protein
LEGRCDAAAAAAAHSNATSSLVATFPRPIPTANHTISLSSPMAYSHNSNIEFNAPFFLGGFFGDVDEEFESLQRAEQAKFSNSNAYGARDTVDYHRNLYYETVKYKMLELTLSIRQFDDHPTNANAVWPEASFLAEWLMGINVADNNIIDLTPEEERITCNSSIGITPLNVTRFNKLLIEPEEEAKSEISINNINNSNDTSNINNNSNSNVQAKKKRVLELGSATGALAIYLAKHNVDIISSDLNDPTVTQNIEFNFQANGLTANHLVYSWNEENEKLQHYLDEKGYFDIILGSDILAYEDSFSNLAEALNIFIPPGNYQTIFYMVWKRRSVRKTEEIFFDFLRKKGFNISMSRQKVYTINRIPAEQPAKE